MTDLQQCLREQHELYNQHVSAFAQTVLIVDQLYDKCNVKLNNVNVTKLITPVSCLTCLDNIQSIPDYFFYNSDISSISLPEGLLHIGNAAFMNCRNLVKIHIPDSVVYIGKRAFQNCSSLKSVNIPKSLYGISHKTFFNCEKLSEIHIPDNVVCIGDEAFKNDTMLSSVSLSKNLGGIFCGSFENCRSLTDMSIPDNGTFVRLGKAFQGCTNLSSINLPDSIGLIDEGVFAGCKLKKVKCSNKLFEKYHDRLKLYLYYRDVDQTIYDEF